MTRSKIFSNLTVSLMVLLATAYFFVKPNLPIYAAEEISANDPRRNSGAEMALAAARTERDRFYALGSVVLLRAG